MLTSNYKGYTIVVSALDTNLGKGFRAAFSIHNPDGTYSNHQCYDTYRRKSMGQVVDDVCAIIDSVC